MFMISIIGGEKLDMKPFFAPTNMDFAKFLGHLSDISEKHRIAYEAAEAAASGTSTTTTADDHSQSSSTANAP